MIPEITNPQARRQAIADADDEELKRLRDIAYSTMEGLLKRTQPGTIAHPEYASLSDFVGEIQAEQQKRTTKLHIETDDPELRSKLKATYDRVRPHFDFGDVRVLCFMAKGDDENLVSKARRGFHLALAKYYDPSDPRLRNDLELPVAVTDLLRDANGALNYDHLVYLHGSITLHPVGCVLSFAHELQHVRQYEERRDLLDESQQIGCERWFLNKGFINLPHEKDAMFASRRIAEKIHGRSKVNEYINEQLEIARHLEPEAAHRESVIWNYQAKWEETFSLKDEVESAK